jgi:hypothetical protein
MRPLIGLAAMAGVGIAGALAYADPASAEIVIAIDKSIQRMAVVVDGREQHVWKVSTGTGGGPKSGTYRPQRLEKSWYSRKYNMSPMPHAIFFHEGYAIHGTTYVSRLGNRASHGCVRLHPANAATLFNLVRSQGMGSTTIVVSNAGWPAMAKKPTPEAPVKASLPVSSPPKSASASAAPVVVPVTQPPRPSVEQHRDTASATTGAVVVRAAEPPSLTSASSKPAVSEPKGPHSEFQE